MLIICTEKEKFEIQNRCYGRCECCVFEKIRCPIEWNMIITDNEVSKGKNLEVSVSK